MATTVVAFLILAGQAAPTDAQVRATVVMKSGERHQGDNPHLSENGAFVLRKPSSGELRARATEIVYMEFAESPGSPPEISDTEHAVVLRNGSVLKGRVIDMAHVMHDDESSDYVVRFRDSEGEVQRLLSTQIARIYFSAGIPGQPAPR